MTLVHSFRSISAPPSRANAPGRFLQRISPVHCTKQCAPCLILTPHSQACAHVCIGPMHLHRANAPGHLTSKNQPSPSAQNSVHLASSQRLTRCCTRVQISEHSHRLLVAYQGVPGAYSEQAALLACPLHEPLPCAQFEVAFQALSQWMADRACLPIENSLGGAHFAPHPLLQARVLFVLPVWIPCPGDSICKGSLSSRRKNSFSMQGQITIVFPG